MTGLQVAIVHNRHTSTTPSGEDAVVAAEAAALRRAGIDVSVLGTSNDAQAARPLPALRGAVTVATGVGVSPRRELAALRPDIVHVHSLFPHLDQRWLKRVDAPIVATVHNYRAVCANGYLFRDGAVCTLCPDGRRWSGVRHGCYRGSRLASLPHAIGTRRGPVHDPVLAAARRVLLPSERARSVLVEAGVDEDRLVVDRHFLPDELDPGVAPDGDRDNHWLFVGRLSAEKGIDKLVAAWPDREPLRIIGDGDLRAAVERGAAGKAVEILGLRDRHEVMSQLRRSFGLVFPSRWYETFGLVYMEALAAGVPTLAFEPNVVAEAVARDGTGLVAHWEALPAAIADAHASFDALRRRCRETFEAGYGEKAFVERRLSLYNELAS